MSKNKVSVTINGREYTIRSEDPETYLYRVGLCVESKINEIVEAFPSISTTDAAVMAALSIADELIKLRDESERLDAKITNALNGGGIKQAMLDSEANSYNTPEEKKQRISSLPGAPFLPRQANGKSNRKDVFIPTKSKQL